MEITSLEQLRCWNDSMAKPLFSLKRDTPGSRLDENLDWSHGCSFTCKWGCRRLSWQWCSWEGEGNPTTYDSRMVMYNTQNCGIYVWDTRTNSNAWTLKIIPKKCYVSFLVISPCGNWFVSRSSRDVLTLSCPKTHFKGMTIILHLKLEGLKCHLTQTIIL